MKLNPSDQKLNKQLKISPRLFVLKGVKFLNMSKEIQAQERKIALQLLAYNARKASLFSTKIDKK